MTLKKLFQQERALNRTLFGSHVDDIQFYFYDKKARNFASRGQQKLFVLLIKVAQINMMQGFTGVLLFLLDDFISDFDNHYISQATKMIDGLSCKKIISYPSIESDITQKIFANNA